jgi:hypothetical protein
MRHSQHPHQPAVHYDFARHRLWILGQRCHHGAVGAVLAATAWAWIASPARARDASGQAHSASPAIVLASAAGALMAHDWKDHALWFERGAGTQP